MLQLSERDLRDVRDWPSLIEALRAMFRDGCIAPPRHHHDIALADGSSATLLLMPAWRSEAYSGVKLVTVYPRNSDIGLPAIVGLYVLFDGQTGRTPALLDGAELTAP